MFIKFVVLKIWIVLSFETSCFKGHVSFENLQSLKSNSLVLQSLVASRERLATKLSTSIDVGSYRCQQISLLTDQPRPFSECNDSTNGTSHGISHRSQEYSNDRNTTFQRSKFNQTDELSTRNERFLSRFLQPRAFDINENIVKHLHLIELCIFFNLYGQRV